VLDESEKNRLIAACNPVLRNSENALRGFASGGSRADARVSPASPWVEPPRGLT
jgi:hypothetical protein